MLKHAVPLAALVPFLWACNDTTEPDGAELVPVLFQAAAPAGTQPVTSITLTGGGNTLVLEDIRLIVAEIELERAEGECVGEDDDDACEEFEGGPFLVSLLDGTADEVVTGLIPPGTYTEFEFEVEDLDADQDDDEAERQRMLALLAQMRLVYPGFPDDASMVVSGTYNGTPFTVYFDAEIEVEKEFATPFLIPGSESILVYLMPSAWFMVGGQPLDLAALDGQTVELEFDFESGVEIDDDD